MSGSLHEWCVFAVTLAGAICVIPAVIQLVRRRWAWEAGTLLFSSITSFMYHSCDAFKGSEFFLDELHWHRLDNIAGIASFGALFAYLCNLRSPFAEQSIKFCALFLTVLLQERAPWDLWYTFTPVLLFASLPFAAHIFVHRRWPAYDWRSFGIGFGSLAVATVFFVLGLDDANDPCRLFHGLWHMVGSLSALYCWRVVKFPSGSLAAVQTLKI